MRIILCFFAISGVFCLYKPSKFTEWPGLTTTTKLPKTTIEPPKTTTEPPKTTTTEAPKTTTTEAPKTTTTESAPTTTESAPTTTTEPAPSTTTTISPLEQEWLCKFEQSDTEMCMYQLKNEEIDLEETLKCIGTPKCEFSKIVVQGIENTIGFLKMAKEPYVKTCINDLVNSGDLESCKFRTLNAEFSICNSAFYNCVVTVSEQVCGAETSVKVDKMYTYELNNCKLQRSIKV